MSEPFCALGKIVHVYYSFHDAFEGRKKGFESDCDGGIFSSNIAICHKFLSKMNRSGWGFIQGVRDLIFVYFLGIFC